MNLKKHTTSLEISLALRDAGYPQGVSIFYWVDDGEGELHDWTVVKEGWTQMKKIDAPLASELMERMPDGYFAYRRGSSWFTGKDLHQIAVAVASDSMPNALATLWLHLNKEGLLK